MKKNIYPGLLLASVGAITACNSEKKIQVETNDEVAKPNIVFILADDLGYNELSCYGQDSFSTPNIDKLASEGMRFTDFYAGNTVCGPSRACLVTGKHPGRVSVRGNHGIYDENPVTLNRVGINQNEITIGEVLKERGYTTALCGKWHLEYFEDSLITWPKYRGFDYVVRERWNNKLIERRNKYEEETGIAFDNNYPYELWENGQKFTIEGNIDGEQKHLMDDIVTRKGLDFITENKDTSFFVFFSLKIPHTPETFSADTGLFKDKGWPECERIHAVRIVYIDQLVKQITDKLDELGLTGNTVIMFSSDNGGQSEGGHNASPEDPCKHNYKFFGSNDPLRGYKRDLYDGGIRVPFIVKWKDVVEPGSESSHIGAFWDFLPTFAEIAGTPVKDYDHDGISFLPCLKGDEQPTHEYLYWEFHRGGNYLTPPAHGFDQAVRMEQWKAVRHGVKSNIELYNIFKDQGENTDVSKEFPEITAKMDSIMKTATTETAVYPYGGGVNLDPGQEIVVISP